MPERKGKRTLLSWSRLAERRVSRFSGVARRIPALRRLGPGASWRVSVKMIGSSAMKRLNSAYRRKSYATDVLSFQAPEPFRSQGWLGELVVCAPVLERQAKERKHSSERELDVLLAHGLLHLLGLDHERSSSEAARMSRFEEKLLSGQGLVAREHSPKP
jgi:probable rRNA maturation factor